MEHIWSVFHYDTTCRLNCWFSYLEFHCVQMSTWMIYIHTNVIVAHSFALHTDKLLLIAVSWELREKKIWRIILFLSANHMTKHLFFSFRWWEEYNSLQAPVRMLCASCYFTSSHAGCWSGSHAGCWSHSHAGCWLVPILGVGLVPILAVGLIPKPMYYCSRQIFQRYWACTSLQLCVESVDNRSCTTVLVQGRAWWLPLSKMAEVIPKALLASPHQLQKGL